MAEIENVTGTAFIVAEYRAEENAAPDPQEHREATRKHAGRCSRHSFMQAVVIDSETLERFQHLRFVLLPLLVYALAVVLFEASADPERPFTALLLQAVQAGGVPSVAQALVELKARLAWFAAALLSIVVSLVAMLYCVVTLRRLVGRGQLIVTATIGALLGAVILGQLVFGAGQGSAMYQLVFGFTYSILAHAGIFGNEFLHKVYAIIALINVLAAIAPAFILMTTCATVASKAIEDDPEHWWCALATSKRSSPSPPCSWSSGYCTCAPGSAGHRA